MMGKLVRGAVEAGQSQASTSHEGHRSKREWRDCGAIDLVWSSVLSVRSSEVEWSEAIPFRLSPCYTPRKCQGRDSLTSLSSDVKAPSPSWLVFAEAGLQFDFLFAKLRDG